MLKRAEVTTGHVQVATGTVVRLEEIACARCQCVLASGVPAWSIEGRHRPRTCPEYPRIESSVGNSSGP